MRSLTFLSVSLVVALAGAAPARAQDKELVVVATGGAFEQSLRKHFYEPFAEQTGVRIRPVAASNAETWTKVKAMREANAIGWDIVTAWPEDLVAQADSLAKLDCSRLSNLASQAVDGACTERGLLRTIGGVSIVYDANRFPQGGPQNWADFWDVKRFPGPRAMPNAGAPWWPLMAALMADGVPRDKLFPLDLDRAFRKLDELRPSIAVWWRTGDQSMQLLRSGEVVMSMMWSGSGFVLKDQGMPVSVVWNEAVPNVAYWSVLKGGANEEKVYAFLNYYLTRPEAHVAFANAFKYDTSNRNALELLSAEERAVRGSTPENVAKMAVIDAAWVAVNRAAVIERWNRWLSK
ncbi:hypothetical protein TSO221_00805 [Azospirillum sp. TSO22-1]|nr:hypothetical protein TSO221_00805 [Azospirillum sp. TSO22-1]